MYSLQEVLDDLWNQRHATRQQWSLGILASESWLVVVAAELLGATGNHDSLSFLAIFLSQFLSQRIVRRLPSCCWFHVYHFFSVGAIDSLIHIRLGDPRHFHSVRFVLVIHERTWSAGIRNSSTVVFLSRCGSTELFLSVGSALVWPPPSFPYKKQQRRKGPPTHQGLSSLMDEVSTLVLEAISLSSSLLSVEVLHCQRVCHLKWHTR